MRAGFESLFAFAVTKIGHHSLSPCALCLWPAVPFFMYNRRTVYPKDGSAWKRNLKETARAPQSVILSEAKDLSVLCTHGLFRFERFFAALRMTSSSGLSEREGAAGYSSRINESVSGDQPGSRAKMLSFGSCEQNGASSQVIAPSAYRTLYPVFPPSA